MLTGLPGSPRIGSGGLVSWGRAWPVHAVQRSTATPTTNTRRTAPPVWISERYSARKHMRVIWRKRSIELKQDAGDLRVRAGDSESMVSPAAANVTIEPTPT